MRHIIFETNSNNKYKIAVLIKEKAFNKELLEKHYIDPLVKLGIAKEDIIGLSLKYNEAGKAPVKLIKPHIETIVKACEQLEITTLLVADSEYFKKFTGMSKADTYHGYVKPCKSNEDIDVILTVNYQALFYNPTLQEKIDLSLKTLNDSIGGITLEIGHDIIHSEYYPSTYEEIKDTLDKLMDYPVLTCDFETFGLKHYSCGIGTVAFAWNQHNGVSFSVDYTQPLGEHEEGIYGEQWANLEVRDLLKEFFEQYNGKLIFHNAGYDTKVAIYNLWMNDIIDQKGLYKGLDIMTNNFDCTQVITYLATNSCSGNTLGLKANAHNFAGNYAEDDIKDIRRIPEDKLLRYNLIDCLSTWYVYNKNYPIMVMDQQEDPYETIMKDSLVTLIQMELTGLPMCMETVLKTEIELQKISAGFRSTIMSNPIIKDVVEILKLNFLDKDFADRKGRAKNPDKIKPKLLENIKLEFNPGSGKQVTVLLYTVMGLPVIEKTDKGFPSTDEKTLTNLINHTDNDSYKELIQAILDLGKVDKILTTFIPAFKNAQLASDGIYYLFGSYKLGGTISNRLSSSSPNLQNLPSGSLYGKLIKACFRAIYGWLFCGADFASLEDRINALLTRDTNKLKIYIDGFDGHSLRAYSYFEEHMPGITNKLQRVAQTGKFYKVTLDNNVEYYHEDDLPEEVKRNITL